MAKEKVYQWNYPQKVAIDLLIDTAINKAVAPLEERITDLESTVRWQKICMDRLARVSDDNRHAKRTNLIVTGVDFDKKESDAKLRLKVINEFARLNCGVGSLDIDRVHRSDYKPGAIVVRFRSWYARNCVYDVRKKSEWFFEADLTDRRQSLLNLAKNALLDTGNPAGKFLDYVFADPNCSLMAKCKSGKLLGFSSEYEFYRAVQQEEDSSPPRYEEWQTFHLEKEKQSDLNLINLHHVDYPTWSIDPSCVFIGRKYPKKGIINDSPWAMPNQINDELSSPQEKLIKFKEYITSENFPHDLGVLRGKILGCYCGDINLCHGNVILDVIGENNTNRLLDIETGSS